MNEEMDKLYQDLNQETDTNHNLLESIEVSRQEMLMKTEEMQEEIQSRNVLIQEFEGVIQELTEQLQTEKLEREALEAKNKNSMIHVDLLQAELPDETIDEGDEGDESYESVEEGELTE